MIASDLFEHLSIDGMERALDQAARLARRAVVLTFFRMSDIPEHVVRPKDAYYVNRLSRSQVEAELRDRFPSVTATPIASWLAEHYGYRIRSTATPGPSSRNDRRLGLRLHDGKDVPTRVHEPGRPGMAHVGDPVRGDRIGGGVLLDAHAASPEVDSAAWMSGTRQAICVWVSAVPTVLSVTAIWVPPPHRKTIRSPASSRRMSRPSVS